MKKKLLFIGLPLLIVIIGAAAAYKFVMPKPKVPKPHLVGTVYALPGSFTMNLAGNHYATMSIALLLPALPKTGLADQPVIRSIITNDVTDQPADALITAHGRAVIAHQILDSINKETDATVTRVYFTDLAVQ